MENYIGPFICSFAPYLWESNFNQFLLDATDGKGETKAKSDADLQAELMPQELNPAFVGDKDQPWRMLLPLPRMRRDLDIVEPMTEPSYSPIVGWAEYLKGYSRIVACAVMVVSASIELIVYIIEAYH